MSKFEVSARMKVREGRLEGFKSQAAEVIRLTREKDMRTLRYDWFLSDDESECEIREHRRIPSTGSRCCAPRP